MVRGGEGGREGGHYIILILIVLLPRAVESGAVFRHHSQLIGFSRLQQYTHTHRHKHWPAPNLYSRTICCCPCCFFRGSSFSSRRGHVYRRLGATQTQYNRAGMGQLCVCTSTVRWQRPTPFQSVDRHRRVNTTLERAPSRISHSFFY